MMMKMIMMAAATTLWCEDARADPGFFSRGGAPLRNDLNLVSYVVDVFFLHNTTYFRKQLVILGGWGGQPLHSFPRSTLVIMVFANDNRRYS